MPPASLRAAARLLFAFTFVRAAVAVEPDFEPLRYNHPGLVVDLGVGLWSWPLPMDFDGDGDLDMVVNCPDAPHNGVWFFQNPGGQGAMPVFKPGVRISKALQNVSPSYVDGAVRVLAPAKEFPGFRKTGLEEAVALPAPANPHPNKVRANQWKYVDFDGDGKLDLTVGSEDWTEYGWDDAYDATGRWTRPPLHGYVYWLRNTGTSEAPVYAPAQKIMAGTGPVDTFGMPSQNFIDFDGDGDLDLVCGEFLDSFTYFANIGTRTEPIYAPGHRLVGADGNRLHMDLEMIVATGLDWDGDGDSDLIVGDEDGRVAFIENTGVLVQGMPQFRQPRYFQQQAEYLKFGALVSPVGFDWDGDGLEDLVCGNSAGYVGWFKNLGGSPPKWAAPRRLEADGQTLRIMAGVNGSIQGPAEAKWGYTTLSVADWNADGLPDLVVNSIWGKPVWYRNVGTRTEPRLAGAQAIEVEWPGAAPKPAWVWWEPYGKELVTQWRTTPVVHDFNGDSLNDLAMLDPEGYLVLFQRECKGDALRLLPGKRVFTGVEGSTYDSGGKLLDKLNAPLRLNAGAAGKSGRRKWCVVDWNGDGLLDLLTNGLNATLLQGVPAAAGEWAFKHSGPVAARKLAGHDTSPTPVHWRGGKAPDLVVGAEDGRLYYLANPHAKK